MFVMEKRPIDNSVISKLKDFYSNFNRLPSYSEIADLMGYASKNAAFRLVTKLIDAGILEKDFKGKLKPCPGKFGLPLAGYVQAGFPTPAEEELIDTLSLDEYLVQNPNSSFLLKVNGDSMIDAGINPEDIVIVERGVSAKNGDVVLAEVDREWTLKYFKKSNGKITLIPANKNYPEIIAREELKIAGVIRGLVRKY